MYTFCVLIEVIVYPLQVASEVLSYHRQVMPTELKEYLERPLDEFNNYDIDKYVQKFMYIYCRKKLILSEFLYSLRFNLDTLALPEHVKPYLVMRMMYNLIDMSK